MGMGFLGEGHQLQTRHARHQNIRQHRLHRMLPQHRRRFIRTCGKMDPVFGKMMRKCAFDAVADYRFVIHDEQFHELPSLPSE
ncbi:hypothetical protein D3C76_1491910 [compost metagenome]